MPPVKVVAWPSACRLICACADLGGEAACEVAAAPAACHPAPVAYPWPACSSQVDSKVKQLMSNIFVDQLLTLNNLPSMIDSGSAKPPHFVLHKLVARFWVFLGLVVERVVRYGNLGSR